MDDNYPDWNLDNVKLEPEVMLSDDIETNKNFTVSYPESSDHVPSETSVEQSSAFSDRIDLSLPEVVPSVPEPGSSASSMRGDEMVKIKEELTEDLISSPDSSMDNRQLELAVLEGTSVFPEELIKVKIEDDLAEDSDASKGNRQHLDFMQGDPEIGVEELSMGGRQHFSPETDLPPALKGSSKFPVERVYAKEEINSGEESDNSKNSRQLDLTKANKEMYLVKGMHHGKEKITSCYSVKIIQSFFEVSTLSANVTQKTEHKAENFDVLADDSTCLHSEDFPRLSTFKLDSENSSVVDSVSVSSVSADSVENSTRKDAMDDDTESVPHLQPSTSQQCSATAFKPLDVTSSKENRFSCHLCPAKFNRRFYFKNHMKAHVEGKTISCEQCSAQFKHRQSLLRHLLTHTDTRAFSCDQCPAQFRQKPHLQNHLLTHASEKSFSCDQCSARFKVKCNLHKHLLTHSDERAFSCDKCSAKFKLKCNLQEHLLTHLSERAFSCNLCAARFKQKRGLKMHLLNHTDERAFSCDRCSAGFKRKFDLQRHLLTHSDTKFFTCNQCTAGFKRKADLNRHLLTHSDKKPLSCT